eukprot:TRINITY_DN17286_c0_g2_i1.p1 TRINITY_DN17286_c0_g2~~TRINITY_DN17286_c0_g2_i1.p1  ORF type:complete len:180 (+),score=24.97 TRINITY_DN17286_c0_g2_i1:199-738(+)
MRPTWLQSRLVPTPATAHLSLAPSLPSRCLATRSESGDNQQQLRAKLRKLRGDYLRKSKTLHPDLNPDLPNAKERFQRLTSEYEAARRKLLKPDEATVTKASGAPHRQPAPPWQSPYRPSTNTRNGGKKSYFETFVLLFLVGGTGMTGAVFEFDRRSWRYEDDIVLNSNPGIPYHPFRM